MLGRSCIIALNHDEQNKRERRIVKSGAAPGPPSLRALHALPTGRYTPHPAVADPALL
jgi:hypothetical protein